MLRFFGRTLVLVVAGLFAMVVVWLLWADSGPVIGQRLIDGFVEAGRAFERTTEIDLIDRGDIPGRADQIGHALLWATATLVIGSVRLARRPLWWVAGELAVLSLISEIAQPIVSSNRSFQETDALANLIGVAIGTAGLAVGLGALRLVRRTTTQAPLPG